MLQSKLFKWVLVGIMSIELIALFLIGIYELATGKSGVTFSGIALIFLGIGILLYFQIKDLLK